LRSKDKVEIVTDHERRIAKAIPNLFAKEETKPVIISRTVAEINK
jgi:hypothetical protein